jgi:acetyl-CoA acetyltransferase
MTEVFLCAARRTPIGRYGGALALLRPDDMAAHVIDGLLDLHPDLAVDEVIFGCANQAGEDNRNVARMAVLLSRLGVGVPALTVNRLCASGLDAVILGARAVRDGADVVIAGGVESMTRAPWSFQGRNGLCPQHRGLRHDHRLALRQSAPCRSPWHRLDARNGRERGGRAWDFPRRSGCLRAAQPAAL